MAAKKGKAKRKAGATVKSTVKKRTLNDVGQEAAGGDPFNNQDIKRRLGNYTGAGEHARKGGRSTGIVGQSRQQWKGMKKLPKKRGKG